MQVYKIETHINNDGSIHLPENIKLFGEDVELIIIKKDKNEKNKFTAKDFVDKWLGAVKVDTEDPKFDYLMEKYK